MAYLSLRNVVKHILTKVIANRLKPVMSKLVDGTQSRLIPVRHGYDIIVVSQEILHSLMKK